MFNEILKVFNNEQITQVGYISAKDMTIINPHILPEGVEIKSCIVFLVSYYYEDIIIDNLGVSIYARAKDYHIYFNNLYERILPILENICKRERFFGFADHSPINEKLAAARAGLGVIGKNFLLINKEYGSFVFIGSLLTTLALPEFVFEISPCTGCNLCVNSCPTGAITEKGINRERCLSHISQKKIKSDDELQLLKDNKTVWGCDICQNACPLNKNTKSTEIEFFKTDCLNNFSKCLIESMSEKRFRTYPFSWRGKEVILKNIELSDSSEKNK
ncbi:MAG: hypothetical protein A2Y15_05780 [Clostridiales bacterium GWF2_36_10]|nr:MAG: hypothetical protein A2Y15_05780 [Clostridiales bacterium GWF2_36_10]